MMLVVLIAAPGVLLGIWGLAGHSADWFSWAIVIGLLLWSLYYVLSTRAWVVLLYPDRIETRELTRHRVLAQEEIAGYRILTDWLLFTRRDGGPDFRIALLFPLDASWKQWLHRLTSLDDDDPLEWDTED